MTLMSDPERAGPELENRLAQNVRVDSGLVLVRTVGPNYGLDDYV
jgi:hypothetical protein